MRILFLTHAFNSLTQRLHVELTAAGHDVSVEFDINDGVTREAVALWQPELIVAPFLKRKIPDSVWRHHRCIVLHPGIEGDRGPSALDWAILRGERTWGVTALEANGEMDAGDIWATADFAMRDATKSSLYRNEVTEAAATAMRLALERIAHGEKPRPLDAAHPGVRGRPRPPMRQADRAIDWEADDTASVLRKIRAADGTPGVEDEVLGERYCLYDAHPEGVVRAQHPDARPGTVIARRDGAILRATRDGAIWITHLKRVQAQAPHWKLPASMLLGAKLARVPEVPLAPEAVVDYPTWRPIRYEEAGRVGYVHFPFYNGAMGTAQCEALRAAYRAAKARPTRVIVLMGGPDFWSNGIHLNLIEASAHPAEESWRNINAIDDLVREIILTDRQLTVAAMRGNAGAGGVFLALAADRVYARSGVILNPHYKSMGNLYGSEYWTYLLPRRVTSGQAQRVMQNRLPVGAPQATAMGLIDGHFGATPEAFDAAVRSRARALAADPEFDSLLARKLACREADEARRPLSGLSCRRARTDEAQLLRFRLELPRRAPPLRLQGGALAHALVARAAPCREIVAQG